MLHAFLATCDNLSRCCCLGMGSNLVPSTTKAKKTPRPLNCPASNDVLVQILKGRYVTHESSHMFGINAKWGICDSLSIQICSLIKLNWGCYACALLWLSNHIKSKHHTFTFFKVGRITNWRDDLKLMIIVIDEIMKSIFLSQTSLSCNNLTVL